jgi:hypothetical protein
MAVRHPDHHKHSQLNDFTDLSAGSSAGTPDDPSRHPLETQPHSPATRQATSLHWQDIQSNRRSASRQPNNSSEMGIGLSQPAGYVARVAFDFVQYNSQCHWWLFSTEVSLPLLLHQPASGKQYDPHHPFSAASGADIHQSRQHAYINLRYRSVI